MDKLKMNEIFNNKSLFEPPVKKTMNIFFTTKRKMQEDECLCGGCFMNDCYFMECDNCGKIRMILEDSKEYNECNPTKSIYKKDEHFKQILLKCKIKNHLHSKLEYLFATIQQAYYKHCGTRKNFLNYYYTLYKLMEMIGEKTDNITMLKRKESIKEHDNIWRKMCEELNYEFISTI